MPTLENQIKMVLCQLDLDEKTRSTERWAILCEAMSREGRACGAFAEFEQKYLQAIQNGGGADLASTVRADMLDNHITAAFAVKNVGIPDSAPVLAWNAKNRSEVVGWHGEIVTMRALLWAGYDPSIPDEFGATALHYMVNLKYGSGCNPRAVRYLLAAGCDVERIHLGGDTALIALCRHLRWTAQHTECLGALAAADADMFAVALDGETPLSLLRDRDASSPSEARQWFIGAIAASLATGALEEGDFGAAVKR